MACALILALPSLLRLALRRVPHLRLSRRLRVPLGGFRRAARERTLRLTDTLVLPDRASLHVVEAEGRRLLIGRSPGTLAVLCELGAGDGRTG